MRFFAGTVMCGINTQASTGSGVFLPESSGFAECAGIPVGQDILKKTSCCPEVKPTVFCTIRIEELRYDVRVSEDIVSCSNSTVR